MDAVPGRIAPEATGSSHDHTYCQPCAEDGKRILPDAFCTVCNEFLCPSCARVHRNMKLTKSHVLQDKSSMPSSFHAHSEADTFTETCQFHTKDFIKYYCLHHEALLCGECLADKTHRSCIIERISQLAKRYDKGTEYNSLKTGLVQAANYIGKLSHDVQAVMKSVDEESLTNINEFRIFRNEINQHLDKRENELLAEIDEIKRTSKTLLNELKTQCTNMKSSIEKLKSELQEQDDNCNRLLIVGKRALKELAGLQAAMEEVSRRSEVPRYKFHRDSATEQLIASEIAIGWLEVGESTSAFWLQQRQQQTKHEQRQQDTMQQHQKHMKAESQKGESTAAAGQQERQQQKEQQPRQLEAMQQQHKHMQGVSPKGESTTAAGQQEKQQQKEQQPRQLETMQQQQKYMQGVSPKALNQCRADLSQSQFRKLPDIPVKKAADTRECFLTSMTILSRGRLLLADCHNCSVKLVDTTTNKMVSQVKLPGQPWDMCLLPGDRAAVTLPLKNKIQFVSTQGNVTLLDRVKVDGYCYGIDFCDDYLVVSFCPGKVVLMNMKGKVKKSLYKYNSGEPLFQNPCYLTVTRESLTPPVIYVPDWSTNTITKLSISLEVLHTYQDPILKSPRGMTAVGDNQLLVCGMDSYNILLLDTLTGKITQLLGREEGIESPRILAYCSQKKMMFVTCSRYKRPELENFVKVFNLV
ncbi:E3 ubiquitin-protein ligase TRIM33-like [Mya arenaria]|uniref:E3 ubiquitin-protein ligase TRIM33-like n=1 Tax=Mya arenaria TaxID=6604 RepID=UPI0022E4A3D3|nr:E3 ubiquitin-protein ligase TRIM33-like [Mya arenaria]XP_052780356.1 E3 ubiquitin-protein ligase TRIM33-like [Mya arenaria]